MIALICIHVIYQTSFININTLNYGLLKIVKDNIVIQYKTLMMIEAML